MESEVEMLTLIIPPEDLFFYHLKINRLVLGSLSGKIHPQMDANRSRIANDSEPVLTDLRLFAFICRKNKALHGLRTEEPNRCYRYFGTASRPCYNGLGFCPDQRRPVWPNPAVPRSESVKASTTCRFACRIGTSTSWAIRSPTEMRNRVLPRFQQETYSDPW